jgi:hypothetical protein
LIQLNGKLFAEHLDLILSQLVFHAGFNTAARQLEWSETIKPALKIIADFRKPR